MDNIDRIVLDNWNSVEDYMDLSTGYFSLSYFEKIIQGNYPSHAYSKGQLASKTWLLSKLDSLDLHEDVTIAILGSWIGSIVEPIIKTFSPKRVYGIDLDPAAIELSEQLNQKYVQAEWRYKGVVADVSALNCSDMMFETGGELINCKPDWLINTSCEHMDSHWFDSADEDQLIIMQTNDSIDYDGHINVCKNVEAMFEKYPMKNIYYAGILEMPAYTRFMQIGKK